MNQPHSVAESRWRSGKAGTSEEKARHKATKSANHRGDFVTDKRETQNKYRETRGENVTQSH